MLYIAKRGGKGKKKGRGEGAQARLSSAQLREVHDGGGREGEEGRGEERARPEAENVKGR